MRLLTIKISQCKQCEHFQAHKKFCLKSQQTVPGDNLYFAIIPEWCELEEVK